MKPHEILQEIINYKGNCDWVSVDAFQVCDDCPMGENGSCLSYVYKNIGRISNKAFEELAIKMLGDMEMERIVLGDDSGK